MIVWRESEGAFAGVLTTGLEGTFSIEFHSQWKKNNAKREDGGSQRMYFRVFNSEEDFGKKLLNLSEMYPYFKADSSFGIDTKPNETVSFEDFSATAIFEDGNLKELRPVGSVKTITSADIEKAETTSELDEMAKGVTLSEEMQKEFDQKWMSLNRAKKN